MHEYVIAKYLRLSLDDAKSESMSIENQRIIIGEHIASLDESNVKVLEFVDNGHSGTNFERPGVQEVLRLVQSGVIDCVIVKDFSRFGRNSLEVGYFIEKVFPLFHTRFISVSDMFDTNDHEEDTGGLAVAIQYVTHEFYSRDLSKKIKSAKRERMRRGEYQSKNCVFGYIKGEDGRLTIDDLAAETVRMIFALAAEGNSYSAIAKRLYDAKRPTPAEYKMRCKRIKRELGSKYDCLWKNSILLNILSDEQYIGTYIAGKTSSIEVGSKKVVWNDESLWIKIPNHHPAIIDSTTFDKVREIREARQAAHKRKPRTQKWHDQNRHSILSGKVVCGCCGRVMNRSTTKNPAFHCRYSIAAPDAECHRLKIMEDDLKKMLNEIIQKQVQVILDTSNADDVWAVDSRLQEHEKRITECMEEKKRLYELFVLHEIDAESYAAQKAECDANLRRLKQALNTISDKAVEQKAQHDSDAAVRDAAKAVDGNGLNQNLVELLVDRVYVYPGERIEIAWKAGNTYDAYVTP